MTTRADIAEAAQTIAAGIELAADVPGADLAALLQRLALMTELLTPPDAGRRYVIETEPAVSGANN